MDYDRLVANKTTQNKIIQSQSHDTVHGSQFNGYGHNGHSTTCMFSGNAVKLLHEYVYSTVHSVHR